MPRMWNVPSEVMCRQHLLGEHHELHMFAGILNQGRTLHGWAKNGHVVTTMIKERHDILVTEMVNRGMNHQSPMDEIIIEEYGHIPSTKENLQELAQRCKACSQLQGV